MRNDINLDQGGRDYKVPNKWLGSGYTLKVKSIEWTDVLEMENNGKKRFQEDASY